MPAQHVNFVLRRELDKLLEARADCVGIGLIESVKLYIGDIIFVERGFGVHTKQGQNDPHLHVVAPFIITDTTFPLREQRMDRGKCRGAFCKGTNRIITYYKSYINSMYYLSSS
jgi:hypothetical protein